MTQYEHIIFVSIEFITLSLHDHMRFEVMNMWKGSWLVLMSHLVTSLITFMTTLTTKSIAIVMLNMTTKKSLTLKFCSTYTVSTSSFKKCSVLNRLSSSFAKISVIFIYICLPNVDVTLNHPSFSFMRMLSMLSWILWLILSFTICKSLG